MSSIRRSVARAGVRVRRAIARANSSAWSNPRRLRRLGDAGTHVTRSAAGAISPIASANSVTTAVARPYLSSRTSAAGRPSWGQTATTSGNTGTPAP